MKKRMLLLFALCTLLVACALGNKEKENEQFSCTFYDLFDTVTTVVGCCEDQAQFDSAAQKIYDELAVYHCLFDIYNTYEGMNNLKTVNDMAGIAPVKVDDSIICLLKDALEYHALTGGRVNAAMGSVLSLWHAARTEGLADPESARLPEESALSEAAQHMKPENVVIDEKEGTVYLADAQMRLDVGAIAKGWSAQRVSENAPSGFLISLGGNVLATGPKDPDGTEWIIGIDDPDGEDFLAKIGLSKGCVVTSGDYQRAYTVNGRDYHHIIDPETLHPSQFWRSVTVVCDDSGLADALSTALFLLTEAEGRALLKESSAEAMWLGKDGEKLYTDGFQRLIIK